MMLGVPCDWAVTPCLRACLRVYMHIHACVHGMRARVVMEGRDTRDWVALGGAARYTTGLLQCLVASHGSFCVVGGGGKWIGQQREMGAGVLVACSSNPGTPTPN